MDDAPGWQGVARTRAAIAQASGSDDRLACLDGSPVGYGFCITSPLGEGGRATARVWISPTGRGQGVGSALWNFVLGVARSAGIRGVHTVAHEADAYSLAVALGHGFFTLGVRRESRLELVKLDEALVDSAVAQIQAEGIELVAFDGGGSEAWSGLYEALLPLFADAPDSRAGREPPTHEAVSRQFAESWQILLARRGEEVIGATMAIARPEGRGRVNTFFTGVAGSERGKGVATALKAEHARRLRQRGWLELWTQNLSQNTPILAANDRLGFRVVRGFQELAFDF
jgi:GNAT superfamily N-acetyltransferase